MFVGLLRLILEPMLFTDHWQVMRYVIFCSKGY